MAEELKACACCGGAAEENWGGCAEFYGHDHQSVVIECRECGLSLSIDTSCEKDGKPSKGYEFACSCCNDIGAVARSRWNTRAQLPSKGGGCRPLGYMNKKDIARLQDEITWDGSYLTVGIDHWAQWQEDTPYDHLQAIYTRPADQVADDLTMVKVSRELLEEIVELHRRRGVVLIIHVEQLAELLNGDQE